MDVSSFVHLHRMKSVRNPTTIIVVLKQFKTNNTEEGLSYLKKELAEHPDNGYVLGLTALADTFERDYGSALQSNKAVKYIPQR